MVYNERQTLRDIALEAYEFVVNGKSGIEWIMARYGLWLTEIVRLRMTLMIGRD